MAHNEKLNYNQPEKTQFAWLQDFFACPECKMHGITYSPDQKTFTCNHCNRIYPVFNNIPHLIVQENENEIQPELHRIHRTSFNYMDHYRKDAQEFDYFQERTGVVAHNERRVREFIAAQVKGDKGIILDIGCGSAWVAERFCRAGWKVVSSDISPLNVKKALTRYPASNHAGVVTDAFCLPFADGLFDYVIASEVIEHVAEPALFIQSLFRVTKPGGTLLVTTPYKEKIVYTLCVHCNRVTPLHAHLHSFDGNLLESLYRGTGLKSVKSILFGNKVLIHLRTHVLLKYFGFPLWKLIDSLANKVYFSPNSILAIWKKSENKTT